MPERFLASVLPQHEVAELYRLMVVGIKDVAVFLMDPHGRITVWNKAAEVMKGFTADDVLGQHLRMLYTDQDREAGRAEHNLGEAARHGVYMEETWRKRKDGSLFWAHIVLTALRGNDEQLLGFSKITMDLTRHRMLEQCEREKEEIDLILTASEAGTWTWRAEANEMHVSKHLMQLLGYEAEPRTLDFDCWLTFVHRDDRHAFRARLEAVRADPATAPIETELRFLKKDGGYHWFFLRANWHRETDNGPLVFLGACVTVDNLKANEEEKTRLYNTLQQERTRFANILEQMPSGIILAESPSGKLTYQNRAAAMLLGRDVEEIDSYNDYSRYNFINTRGERLSAEELPLTRTIRNQEASRSQELLYEREDGTRLHFAVTTASIIDSDGVARIAVAVLHDVSGLKMAELNAASERSVPWSPWRPSRTG